MTEDVLTPRLADAIVRLCREVGAWWGLATLQVGMAAASCTCSLSNNSVQDLVEVMRSKLGISEHHGLRVSLLALAGENVEYVDAILAEPLRVLSSLEAFFLRNGFISAEQGKLLQQLEAGGAQPGDYTVKLVVHARLCDPQWVLSPSPLRPAMNEVGAFHINRLVSSWVRFGAERLLLACLACTQTSC